MTKICTLIKAAGSGNILYGDVLLLKAKTIAAVGQGQVNLSVMLRKKIKQPKYVKGHVLAYYHIAEDVLVINCDVADITASDLQSVSFMGTAIHELGHRVDFKFSSKINESKRTELFTSGLKALGGTQGLGVNKAKLEERGLAQFASPYATTNKQEMFAEAFAAVCMPDYFKKKIGISDAHLKAVHSTLDTYFKH
jgi:hypothetical protein